jgi:hypothetical protein
VAMMPRRHPVSTDRWPPHAGVLAVTLSLVIGMLVVKAPTMAVAVAFLPAVMVMATRSPTVLVASALIAAVAFRGLVGLQVVPAFVQYVHLPLAWGALCVALIRGHPRSGLARRSGIWLFVLGLAVVASALLNESEPLRGPAYFAVLAEPFAIVCALLIEPPTSSERTLLLRTCVVLIAVQIPLAYVQAVTLGLGDSVQGTLYGSGVGAHAVGALVIVGAFWYLGHTRAPLSPIAITVVVAMAGVLVVSDAKQVAFAIPVAIIGQRLLSGRSIAVGFVALALIYIIIHFQPASSSYTLPYIGRALSGDTGKVAAAKMIWHEATANTGTFVFGQGPAETVSRTAYETVPANQRQWSPLQVLGLAPARTAIDAERVASAVVKAKGKSAYIEPFKLDSFDSGTSSGVGLFGDLGMLGFVAYSGLFMTIFVNLRRRRSAEALAAASGFAMLIVLGFVYDWWEVPAFTLVLGALAGLALSERRPEIAASTSTVERPAPHRAAPQRLPRPA